MQLCLKMTPYIELRWHFEDDDGNVLRIGLLQSFYDYLHTDFQKKPIFLPEKIAVTQLNNLDNRRFRTTPRIRAGKWLSQCSKLRNVALLTNA